MRRTLILIVIVIVIALGILLYLFRARESKVPTINVGGLPTPGGVPLPTGGKSGEGNVAVGDLPVGGEQQGIIPVVATSGTKFGIIAEASALAYFVDSSNTATFIQPDGQVVRVVSGKTMSLSSAKVADLTWASFSADGKKIAAASGSHVSKRFSIFDVQDAAWKEFPIGISAAAWSPVGATLAYLAPLGDRTALTTIDYSKKNPAAARVASFALEDAELAWAGASKIVLAQKPSARAAGTLWLYNLKNGSLTDVAEYEPGLVGQWSALGDRGLLFSATTAGVPSQLRLVDENGVVIRYLSFLTLPEKCVFSPVSLAAENTTSSGTPTSSRSSSLPPSSSRFLICAVPRDESFRNAILPDDYLKYALYTTDDVYEINLSDGNARVVSTDPGRRLDAINLSVVNNKLFFINRYDKRVYVVSP